MDIENAFGSGHDDVLIGSAGSNFLQGGLGVDGIAGLAGDDIIAGGTGLANELYGGTGDDYFIVEANDTIVELTGEGIDTVEARVSSFTLAANLENLVYAGTGSFTGTGNSADNVMIGGALDDVLFGGGGNDRLYGGAGMDTVLMRGLESEYLIDYVAGGVRIIDTVAGRDGETLLVDFEQISFAGSLYELSSPVARGAGLGEGAEYPTFRPAAVTDGDPWWMADVRNLEAEWSGC